MSNARRRRGGDQPIPRPLAWHLGEVAPWTVNVPASASEVMLAVESARRGLQPETPTFADARPSAVLVAIADGTRGAEVLLTKRAGHLRNHAGEISFPGGRIESGESPTQAALREAYEEVALPPDTVNVCGN